jgi:hypothetical protein
VRTAFGDWAAPQGAPGDVAAAMAASLDGSLCMFVLHVLSLQQSQQLLARLARCTKPGGLLLGAAVGASVAGEWARTPDGTAPRWLHSEASLREALVAAGWDDNVCVEAAPAGEWGAGAGPPAGMANEQNMRRLQFSASKRDAAETK